MFLSSAPGHQRCGPTPPTPRSAAKKKKKKHKADRGQRLIRARPHSGPGPSPAVQGRPPLCPPEHRVGWRGGARTANRPRAAARRDALPYTFGAPQHRPHSHPRSRRPAHPATADVPPRRRGSHARVGSAETKAANQTSDPPRPSTRNDRPGRTLRKQTVGGHCPRPRCRHEALISRRITSSAMSEATRLHLTDTALRVSVLGRRSTAPSCRR